MSTSGRFTIPSESNFAEKTAELARLWGADAVRNSDGTQLDDEVVALGMKVYTAYFPTRAHNEWITLHMDETPAGVPAVEACAGGERHGGRVSDGRFLRGAAQAELRRRPAQVLGSRGRSTGAWCRPSSGPWTPKRA